MYAATIEPNFFPLSRSQILRLAHDRKFAPPLPLEVVALVDPKEEYLKKQYLPCWEPLLKEVELVRELAYALLEPSIKARRLTTKGFAQLVEQSAQLEKHKGYKIADYTVDRWRDSGLLRTNERGELDLLSAWSALMMRIADRRRIKGWLVDGAEADMYVWRKDSPEAIAVACGIPLLASNVPAHAMLYTPFVLPGRMYDDWLEYSHLGSVRWGATKEENGQLYWDLTKHDLLKWDPVAVARIEEEMPGVLDMLDSVATVTRHSLANLLLVKWARRELPRFDPQTKRPLYL